MAKWLSNGRQPVDVSTSTDVEAPKIHKVSAFHFTSMASVQVGGMNEPDHLPSINSLQN